MEKKGQIIIIVLNIGSVLNKPMQLMNFEIKIALN